MPKPIPIPKNPPWLTQILVIDALLKREVVTRFGEYRLGFFWMLFEPLLGVIVVGFLLGAIAARAVPEIPYSFFVLHGMMLIKLFTGPMNAGVNALGSNQGLLVYPTVLPLDIFISRFFFQLVTTVLSFAVFTVIAMWCGVQISLASLDTLGACYLITWLNGCGLGLILAVVGTHIRETDKILMVLQRPLMFISAVLYPTSGMPDSAQALLLYNPMVHTIELSRQAMFPYYVTGGANLIYPTITGIIFLSVGLTLFNINKNLLSQP